MVIKGHFLLIYVFHCRYFWSKVMSSLNKSFDIFSIHLVLLLQCNGLGKLRTNTMLLGFKTDWSDSSGTEVEEYVDIIQ